MTLLERIDLALQHARSSRTELADAIGVSRQAISNLKRSPGSSLRPEHVARAARFMRCDIYWLCTGEGGEYVPEQPFSALALELATLIDQMPHAERLRACTLLFMASRGHWPSDLHTRWSRVAHGLEPLNEPTNLSVISPEDNGR